MSATLFVEFRDEGFWAYDIIAAVFLRHLIGAATPHLELPGNEWLGIAVDQWRVVASMCDYGLTIDSDSSVSQLEALSTFATHACDELRKRASIPADEILSWRLNDERKVPLRGLPFVATAAVINLGEAIIQLINGRLPEPPADTWWFFATGRAPETLGKRTT